jgi:hypothetical protein
MRHPFADYQHIAKLYTGFQLSKEASAIKNDRPGWLADHPHAFH